MSTFTDAEIDTLYIHYRILNSLDAFTDTLDLSTVNQTLRSNRTSLRFKQFALQVEDITTETFIGQTFTIALGPVEQARNVSTVIDQNALITDDDIFDSHKEQTTTEATATLQLHPMLFEDCITSETNESSRKALSQRLSYSVFLSDAFFLPQNRTLNKVGSIIIGARVRCQLTDETVPIQSSFLTLEVVRCVL